MSIDPKMLRQLPEGMEIGEDGKLKVSGFGDVVKLVAQPIAKAIDAMAGTKLQQCGACEKRRQKLNQVFPIQKP